MRAARRKKCPRRVASMKGKYIYDQKTFAQERDRHRLGNDR